MATTGPETSSIALSNAASFGDNPRSDMMFHSFDYHNPASSTTKPIAEHQAEQGESIAIEKPSSVENNESTDERIQGLPASWYQRRHANLAVEDIYDSEDYEDQGFKRQKS